MTLLSPRRAPRRLGALLLVMSTAMSAGAQQANAPRRLSLDEALRTAERQSEAIAAARAGLVRATGQRYQARSQALPQLNATAGYTKTLKSQFSGLSFGGGGDTAGPPPPPALCAPRIPANATPEQRAAAIAQASTCDQGGGFDFTSTGFGAKNQWAVGLNFSQNVFTGGRIQGQNQAADALERSARVEVDARRAQTLLDVTEAYYDAALADRLVTIATATLAQTEDILTQTKVAREVGNQSEFDLLRAQVTRDNQVPVLIAARSNRQVAYLRLKQLLDIPLDDTLELSTTLPLDAAGATLPALAAVADRAPVRQLEDVVRAQEGLVRVARSERLPSVALVSGYQRLYFPSSTFPTLSDARENWTIGISTNFSLFNGGRVRGGEMIAQANLDEARAQLQQVRELAALDSRVALSQYEQAEAAWRASQGTAEQAQRALDIDQIRLREGISTQTDLAQSRLLLEQAQANRAQAARNLAVARKRIELLRDLPLQGAGGGAPQQSPSSQQQSSQQPPQGASQTGATAGPPGIVQ